jgi:sec-independent protein translocase protein TatA
MGSFSLVHWLVLGAVFVMLFGGGKLAGLGKDLGEGMRAFKKGIGDDDKDDAPKPTKPKQLRAQEPDSDPAAGVEIVDTSGEEKK